MNTLKIFADGEIPASLPKANPVGGDWLLWQLADSAFPAGGFAHSAGLEAAWQHGEVRNRTELAQFVEASLQQLGHASLPLVTASHDEPEALVELDQWCENFMTNHVTRRASRLQGQAFLASAQRIFPGAELQHLTPAAGDNPPYCHFAPVFGVVARALGVGRDAAARLFLFLHLRGVIAGAVRLGIVGPLEAQSMQFSFAARLETILTQCRDLPVAEVAQTAPLIDLWQGAQDRLYSRLFQS